MPTEKKDGEARSIEDEINRPRSLSIKSILIGITFIVSLVSTFYYTMYSTKEEIKDTQSEMWQEIVLLQKKQSDQDEEFKAMRSKEWRNLEDCLQFLDTHTQGETSRFFYEWKMNNFVGAKPPKND